MAFSSSSSLWVVVDRRFPVMLPLVLLMSVQSTQLPRSPAVAHHHHELQPSTAPSCRYLIGFLPALSLSKGQSCLRYTLI